MKYVFIDLCMKGLVDERTQSRMGDDGLKCVYNLLSTKSQTIFLEPTIALTNSSLRNIFFKTAQFNF